MDLLYGLRGVSADSSSEDAIIEDELPDFDPSSIPDVNPSQLPSPEELLKMLDGMTGLSDEDKESLREELMRNIQGGNSFGQNLPPPAAPFTSQALILLALLAVIAMIFEMAEEILNKIKENVEDLSPAVRDRIKSMLGKYRELDEDGKAEFMEHAKEAFKNSMSKYTSGNWAFKFWMLTRSYAVILAAIIFVLSIFVFFGYKLYKSLTEREKKREEKRKLKQQKKKK